MDCTDASRELRLLGENLAQARLRRNLGLAELAEMVGYDRGCLTNLESGLQNVEFRTVQRLAQALDVSLPRLFSRSFAFEESNFFLEEPYLMIFAENLNRLMQKHRRSPIFLYMETGIDLSVISRLRNGKNENPLAAHLIMLSKVFHLELMQMLSRIEMEE